MGLDEQYQELYNSVNKQDKILLDEYLPSLSEKDRLEFIYKLTDSSSVSEIIKDFHERGIISEIDTLNKFEENETAIIGFINDYSIFSDYTDQQIEDRMKESIDNTLIGSYCLVLKGVLNLFKIYDGSIDTNDIEKILERMIDIIDK